jgi:hypothetical protein
MDTQTLSEENMPTFNFKSSFLKKPAALARRPDYMSTSEPKEATGLGFGDPQSDKQRLMEEVSRYKALLAKTKDIQESKDLAFKLSLAEAKLKLLNQKQAAAGSAPREYPVKKDKEGFWYVMGLPGEELSEGMKDAPVVPTPNTWLNVHNEVKGLELAEQLYRELYATFQTNDNLREGDVFSTPVGKFICQGVDVLPYDEPAKRIIGEVDDSYKCGNCDCDQGEHRKKFDDNGYPYYGECTQHPECKEYVKRG